MDLWTGLLFLVGSVSAFGAGWTWCEMKWTKRGEHNLVWITKEQVRCEVNTQLTDDEKQFMRAYLRGRQDGNWAVWKGNDHEYLHMRASEMGSEP